MSILIKNYEVPKSCNECPFLQACEDEYGYEFLYCIANQEIDFNEEGDDSYWYCERRHEKCPIINVPD